LTTPRLLVIDDSLTIRKLVELSFRSTAFAVEFASSGQEGAAKAADASPDVILLDCVLPDMKAAEVCQRLSENERSAKTPIILMSAKDQAAVRETFKDMGRVVDFVGKPFTGEEILGRVQSALSGQPAPAPRPSPPPGRFTFKQTEAAAKALYGRLANALTAMPEWLAQARARGTPVAPMLARRLLTPETVAGILEGLAPICREAADEPGPRTAADGPAPPLEGQLGGWPLIDLLALVGASGRTGELVLEHAGKRVVGLWESGELVLVTHHEPVDDSAPEGVDLMALPAEARARAEAEQRATGKPALVSLAEEGHLPEGVDVARVLNERGVCLLRALAEARPVHFAFRERAALPSYAHAFGRYLSIEHDLGVTAGQSDFALSVPQLTLEWLRRPSAWAEVEGRLPHPDQVFERGHAFSHKLRALRLTASEQRVLTLVERRNTVATISGRCGLSLREVARIVHRLAEIDLVQPLPTGPGSVVSSIVGPSPPLPRPVMILDPDADGFCASLRERLAQRPCPVPLLDLTEEPDLMTALLRERPSLVVLSDEAAPGHLDELARTVRARPELAATALAAVVASGVPEIVDRLAGAGFDAVWTKPVHLLDVSALLASDPATLPWPSSPQPSPQPVPRAREMETHAERTDRR